MTLTGTVTLLLLPPPAFAAVTDVLGLAPVAEDDTFLAGAEVLETGLDAAPALTALLVTDSLFPLVVAGCVAGALAAAEAVDDLVAPTAPRDPLAGPADLDFAGDCSFFSAAEAGAGVGDVLSLSSADDSEEDLAGKISRYDQSSSYEHT